MIWGFTIQRRRWEDRTDSTRQNSKTFAEIKNIFWFSFERRSRKKTDVEATLPILSAGQEAFNRSGVRRFDFIAADEAHDEDEHEISSGDDIAETKHQFDKVSWSRFFWSLGSKTQLLAF